MAKNKDNKKAGKASNKNSANPIPPADRAPQNNQASNKKGGSGANDQAGNDCR